MYVCTFGLESKDGAVGIWFCNGGKNPERASAAAGGGGADAFQKGVLLVKCKWLAPPALGGEVLKNGGYLFMDGGIISAA